MPVPLPPDRPRSTASAPRRVVHAHCDLPCGVYDPAQARIEAESVKAIQEKYGRPTTTRSSTRALAIKEERADLVKHHLWVLWTDYFKPPHLEKYPELHAAVLGRHQGGRRHQGLRRPRLAATSSSTSSPRSTRSSGRPRSRLDLTAA